MMVGSNSGGTGADVESSITSSISNLLVDKRGRKGRRKKKDNHSDFSDTDNDLEVNKSTREPPPDMWPYQKSKEELALELSKDVYEALKIYSAKGCCDKMGDCSCFKVAPDQLQVSYIPRKVLYYGWYFGETVSLSLKNIAFDYMQKSSSAISNLQEFLAVACSGRDPTSYYRKPNGAVKDSKYFHITAKFCGRSSHEIYENLAYNHIGKIFNISIVGLFITKDTFGYRVDLDEVQQELFDDERDRGRNGGAQTTNSNNSHSHRSTTDNEISSSFTKLSLKSGGCPNRKTTKTGVVAEFENPSYPGLVFLQQPTTSFQPSSTRAHITIGCGIGVKAMRTGEDLLDIINLEKQVAAASGPTSTSSSASVFTKDYRVEDKANREMNLIVRQFGRQHGEAYVIYPQHKIMASAIFMPYA